VERDLRARFWTFDGISIQPAQTKPVNLLSLVEELKK
jgi:hypothetical protein